MTAYEDARLTFTLNQVQAEAESAALGQINAGLRLIAEAITTTAELNRIYASDTASDLKRLEARIEALECALSLRPSPS